MLTETTWLLRHRPDAIQRLFEQFRTGLLKLAHLDEKALRWAASFLRRYEDLEAQLADAALMYLAERDGLTTVFTIDRRDFTVYRLTDGRAVTLIPSLG